MDGSRSEVGDGQSDIGSVKSSNKLRRSALKSTGRRRDLENGGAEEEDDDEDQSGRGDGSSSTSGDDDDGEYGEDDDEEEEEWHGGENGELWHGAEDEEAERPTKNLCIHCGADEDSDPSPEYEDPLECTVCGAFSHRQCDRTENEGGGVKSAFDEETSKWRCPTCAAGDPEPGLAPSLTERTRRSNSIRTENVRNLRKRKVDDLGGDDLRASVRRRKRGRIEKLPGDETNNENEDISPMDSFSKPEGLYGRGTKSPGPGPKVTYTHTARKFILHLQSLQPEKLKRILIIPPKPQTAEHRPRRTGNTASHRAQPEAIPALAAPAAPLPSFSSTAHEGEKPKPYGGILTDSEAATAETLPTQASRACFEKARLVADREREARLKLSASMNAITGAGQKGKDGEKKTGGATKIDCIHFGDHEIDTWYAAPYPEEYSKNRVLWICEFCLKYMNSEYVSWRHKMKCDAKHPPGDEIYRDDSISVFEIDGRKNPVYCQNLCLLAKLFLGSKTLYYDVEPFLFYVMTECDEFGMHFVGYFSKEKRLTSQHNVSCILTLPIHQRKGYGNLLIAFSYLLTRCEKKTGSPEKPFSDLGLVSYRNYWKLTLCYALRHQTEPLTIHELSARTGMTADDIVCGLEALQALIRDPVTGTYALRLDYAAIQAHIDKWEAKGYVKLNPDALVWTPFLMGRSQAMHLNDAPLSTIAPRLEDNSIPIVGEIRVAPTSEANAERKGDSSTSHDQNGTNPLIGDAIDLDKIHLAPPVPENLRAHSDAALLHNNYPPIIKFGTEPASLAKWKTPTRSSTRDIGYVMLPPTRFEIVPPVPAPSTKKVRAGSSAARGGRRGHRVSMSPATPRGKPAESPLTKLRRGRTKLTDTFTLNGTPSTMTRERTKDSRASPAVSSGTTREGIQEGAPPGAVDSGMRTGVNMIVTSQF